MTETEAIRENYNLGVLAGEAREQQRIIKLLEVYFRPEEAKAIYPADYEQYLDLIALIKGRELNE